MAQRRQAALARLQGERAPVRRVTKRPTATASATARERATSRRPARQAARREAPLGPPPVSYYVIALVVAVFVMLGLVMVLSSSAATEAGKGNSPYHIFSRQVIWACLGFVGLLVAAKVPYHRWRPLVVPGAVLSGAAMLLPFVPGVGATINGAHAWVSVGGLTFQPSEILKLATLALAAHLLANRQNELQDHRRGLIPLVLVAAGGAGACLLQGDLGAAIVLGSIVLAVGFVAGVPFAHLATVCAGGAGVLALFVLSSPRRFNRFTAFANIDDNKDYLSYQTYQGFLSMANGGLTGSGIGGSNSKLGYLPYAHSDFIFAVVADELGFVGSVAVVGGFALLVWYGVQASLAAPDRFGMLLAGGIAAWFGVQAIVNLGGVTGLMPVTGLTLPFFSAGGTSLFMTMIGAGLLLNVARRGS